MSRFGDRLIDKLREWRAEGGGAGGTVTGAEEAKCANVGVARPETNAPRAKIINMQ